MTDIRKVEEGLGALFREQHGVEAKVHGFEDITVGWETQIVAFRLSKPGTEDLHLIARIYSGLGSARKAEREFNVMRNLATVSYPVPRVYTYEIDDKTLGSPFIVMERILGGTLWDVFFTSPKEKYGEVLALNSLLMAQLHNVPPWKVLPGSSRIGTRRHARGRVEAESRELAEYRLATAFAPLINWLNANAGGIVESPPCLIHQDLHPRNILLRQDGTPVVIDWSSCLIGDFREDLCWTALLAGTFVDESLKVAVYDAYAKTSTRALVDLHFFEALVSLRRLTDAVITMKAGAEARGMRPEAAKEMKGNKQHYLNILEVLVELTGVRLPEVDLILGA